MGKEKHNILRCPICAKGRVADIPARTNPAQYQLFPMQPNNHADLISKCPKCGEQIGIVILHRTVNPQASVPSVKAVGA